MRLLLVTIAAFGFALMVLFVAVRWALAGGRWIELAPQRTLDFMSVRQEALLLAAVAVVECALIVFIASIDRLDGALRFFMGMVIWAHTLSLLMAHVPRIIRTWGQEVRHE